MVGEHAIAAAIEDHRAPDRLLSGLQLTNDLANTDGCVLFGQHVREVDFDGTQQVRQGPGLTARFIEHVVNLHPRGFDDFFVNHRHLTRLQGFGFQRAIEFDPAHTGRQTLRQRTQTCTHVTQPVVQVVGTGVKQGVFLIRVRQASLVAAQGIDAFLILRLAGRQHPALVVEVETRLGLGQIRVFSRLRLGAGKVFAQGTGQVAYLHQNAVFPARNVVEHKARREAVIGQVTARLVEQRAGHGFQGFDGGEARHHLLAFALGSLLGVLLHREQIRLLTPVPAEPQAHQHIHTHQGGNGAAQQDAFEIATRLCPGLLDRLAGTALTFFPVQHGYILSITEFNGSTTTLTHRALYACF